MGPALVEVIHREPVLYKMLAGLDMGNITSVMCMLVYNFQDWVNILAPTKHCFLFGKLNIFDFMRF